MILGAPKSVRDFPKLKREEIDALANTLTQLLAQGAPVEAPLGVPLGSLGQLVHTALGAFPEETPAEPVVEAIPADAVDRPRLVLPV